MPCGSSSPPALIRRTLMLYYYHQWGHLFTSEFIICWAILVGKRLLSFCWGPSPSFFAPYPTTILLRIAAPPSYQQMREYPVNGCSNNRPRSLYPQVTWPDRKFPIPLLLLKETHSGLAGRRNTGLAFRQRWILLFKWQQGTSICAYQTKEEHTLQLSSSFLKECVNYDFIYYGRRYEGSTWIITQVVHWNTFKLWCIPALMLLAIINSCSSGLLDLFR